MKEKEELEVRMREELEDQLQVKEATLMEYLEDQRQNLLKEKADVEQRLQAELESALEKDKALAEELEKQKQNLEKVGFFFAAFGCHRRAVIIIG